MADEAVVRIIMQDQGGAGSQNRTTSDSSAPTTVSPPYQSQSTPPQSYQNPPPPRQAPPTTAAADRYLEAEAKAALEVERKREAAIEDARKADVAYDARRRELLEVEARAALAVVRKRQEAAEAAQKAEFDPQGEARKRREAERRAAQVEDAYKREYGDPGAETQLDSLLKVADSLRGTIGGLAGTTVGAALDVAVGFRRAQVEAERKKSKADLLSGDTTSAASKAAQAAKGTTGAAEGAGEAAAAEGALGGAGGIAAAAGPIGLVIAAVEAVKRGITDAVRGTIGGAGALAAAVASPGYDPSVSIGQLGDATSRAGDKVMQFNVVLGAATIAAGETARALSTLMQALDATANRYGEFSPAIAQQQAIVEVRHMSGDLRRSTEVGMELARYVQAQGDLQEKFEDVKVRLLTKMLPGVTRILEVLETMLTGGENIVKGIEVLATPLTEIASAAADLVGMQRDDRAPDVNDPTDVILKSGEAGGVVVPQI